MANSNIKSVGGQALIEGVMMRGPKDIAMAVRKPDNGIEVKKQAVSNVVQRHKGLKLPIVRGGFALIDSMVLGVRSLMYSAEIAEEGIPVNEEPDRFERFMRKVFKEKADDVLIYFSVFIALSLAILIFMVSPTLISGVLTRFVDRGIVLSMIEGIIRLVMFIIYIVAISRLEDIQRVFQYHGAEHKAIYCYEQGDELTVENARKYTTLHPRCGTSFLFIVMMVSIIVFSLISWQGVFMRVALRIALLPLVAGISYEVIKYAGKSQSPVMKLVSFPGMMMQKLTTKEPDDSQLEVALEALKSALGDDEEIPLA
ncbi:DUF1385 domain-containing protein [Serpentinicella sp. ANB-PHB4]|uniref:DUF1385 domain-containing protein n=1 Tax=Serpentinicella sp. ANB-PHB4 TaxID=3074076 RepID=UPI002864AB5F|nr:DUF1385 domain-containing protein [Serpentinicella sp. ANB-PHB4]MDR5659740.1 DUF1385 domain-containing protein [Serpentinicella sp. ANB-PHB4]